MWFIELLNTLFKRKAPVVKKPPVVPVVEETPVVVSPAIDSSATVVVEVISKIEETKMVLPLDLMKVTYKESPNKSDRRDEIRGIVLHHTGPGGFSGIVDWLCNPEAKASAHYVVGTKAEITQLVNTKRCAWHAGKSTFLLDGVVRNDLNHCTIGIEICNPGVLQKGEDGKFYYEAGRLVKEWKGATPVEGTIIYPSGNKLTGYYVPYPQEQIDKIIALCKALVIKYPQIGREDILTHYGIATPEGRKNDPFGLDVQDIINKIFGG